MVFGFNPSYSADVCIHQGDLSNGNILYQKTFNTPKEFNDFKTKFCQSRNVPFYLYIFVPTRTENLKIFLKDLFPNVTWLLSKIAGTSNDTVLKTIYAVAFIFVTTLDLITLPIRLLTSPFSAWHNYRRKHLEKKHPLIDLIEKNGQMNSLNCNLNVDGLDMTIDENAYVFDNKATLDTGHLCVVEKKVTIRTQITVKKMPNFLPGVMITDKYVSWAWEAVGTGINHQWNLKGMSTSSYVGIYYFSNSKYKNGLFKSK